MRIHLQEPVHKKKTNDMEITNQLPIGPNQRYFKFAIPKIGNREREQAITHPITITQHTQNHPLLIKHVHTAPRVSMTLEPPPTALHSLLSTY